MIKQTVASTKRNVKGNALPLHAKLAMTGGAIWNLLLVVVVVVVVVVVFIGFIFVVKLFNM
jgi:hypothetical protein